MGRARQVTLKRSGKTFAVEPGERILDAALRQEVWLPYACRGGTCGSCTAIVVDGVVDHGPAQPRGLRQSEARLCVALAVTDITLDVEMQANPPVNEVRRVPARVIEIARPFRDVAILTLKLPPTERLIFRPGQYVNLLAPDGRPRPFSIANAPRADGTIELHIGRIPGGAFTSYLLDELEPGTILRLEGPRGSFGLLEDSMRPAVFIAGGTGIAPIKAILEAQAQAPRPRRRMYVYWGSRRPEGLYALEAVASTASSAGAIRFAHVVSEPASDDSWKGRTGLVHHAVLEDLPDLCNFEAYVCGGPPLVEAARRDLTEKAGLPPDRFISDAFNLLTPIPEQASTA